MVIVMKPSWRSPDEGLGYCTVKCHGSIPRERIREPRSSCGGQALGLPSLRHFWLSLGARRGDGAGNATEAKPWRCLRVGTTGFVPLESPAAGGSVCSRPAWPVRPLGPALPREATPGLPCRALLSRPTRRVCDRGHAGDGHGCRSRECTLENEFWAQEPPFLWCRRAGSPPLCMHIPRGIHSSAAAIRLLIN